MAAAVADLHRDMPHRREAAGHTCESHSKRNPVGTATAAARATAQFRRVCTVLDWGLAEVRVAEDCGRLRVPKVVTASRPNESQIGSAVAR